MEAIKNVSHSKHMDLTFIYDCKTEGNYLEKLEQVMTNVNHVIKKIPDMQEELGTF